MTMNYIEFIETSVFARQRETLLTEDEYRAFQEMLIINPLEGDLIQGTGGCRKVRFAPASHCKGKSGGIRSIYYFQNSEGRIWLFMAYPKNKKDSLSGEEKNSLKSIIHQLKEGSL